MGRYDDIDEVDETEAIASRVPTAVVPRPSAPDERDARPNSGGNARQIKRGWGAADKVKNADSQFAQRLKISEDPVIIKFLEDEPYASFRFHWIERPGQKSFTCIADLDNRGCPLCNSGSRPSTRFAFNVVLLEPDTEPMIKSYEVGPRGIDQLKNFHTNPTQGPLSKHYWAVSRTGKGTTSSTAHQLVKDRDLIDDWYGISPIPEGNLRDLRSMSYTADIIQIPDWKDLQKIAIEDLGD